MATLQDIMQLMFRFLLPTLSEYSECDRGRDVDRLSELDDAIEQTRIYLQQLSIGVDNPEMLDRYSCAVHILDHLYRVARRAHDSKRLARVRHDSKLSAMTDQLVVATELLIGAEYPISLDRTTALQQINQDLKSAMQDYRLHILRRTASGRLSTNTALKRTDTARWIRRVGYHAWRISDHASGDSPHRVKTENTIAALPEASAGK